MSEIERAISVLQDCEDSAKDTPFAKVYHMSIDALREKAERESRAQPDNAPQNCNTCKYSDRTVDMEPCKHCRDQHLSKYARKPEPPQKEGEKE